MRYFALSSSRRPKATTQPLSVFLARKPATLPGFGFLAITASEACQAAASYPARSRPLWVIAASSAFVGGSSRSGGSAKASRTRAVMVVVMGVSRLGASDR